MPTYDYRCPNGHAFEVFKKMSEPPGSPCPKCGEMGERQISGGAGFLLKGDGFYITDYRSKDYQKKAEAESPSGSSGSTDAPSSGSGNAGSPAGGSGAAGSSGSDQTGKGS